jgi:hypothetical protein
VNDMRDSVLAPRCICSLYLNVIFDTFGNVKKFKQKFPRTSSHVVCVQSRFTKTDLSFSLRKKTNFGAKNKKFYGTCFFFFTLTT